MAHSGGFVAKSCLTLCNPRDCSPSGSSVHGMSGKNTGVGCHFLLQGIFPTQGSNLCLPCLLQVSYTAGEFFTAEPQCQPTVDLL